MFASLVLLCQECGNSSILTCIPLNSMNEWFETWVNPLITNMYTIVGCASIHCTFKETAA